MSEYQLQALNLQDPKDIAVFEKNFYLKFKERVDHPLTQLIWECDHEKKLLKPRIGYQDKIIYGIKRGEKWMMFVMFNLATDQKRQYEYFDFVSENDAGEVPIVFSIDKDFMHWSNFSVVLHFWNIMLNQSKVIGFKKLYATCPNAVILRYYRSLGFQHIGTREFGEDVRYFLSIDIEDWLMNQEHINEIYMDLSEAKK